MTTLAHDVASDLAAVLFRRHEEASYEVDNIEGSVPDFVRGTWYLNGPAGFERGGRRYNNWLDGDGMVCAVRFDGDSIRFTSRFVRTRKSVDEEHAGRFLYRTFGTAFADDRLKRGWITESPANVSVIPFNGRLLAFGEQSIPIELDPATLATGQPFDFNGHLNDVSPFSAHPKIDPPSGELFNFGISFSARQPRLNYYRFDPAGQLLCRTRIPIDFPCSLHDFAISPNSAVFYLSPYTLNMEALAGGSSTIDALEWRNQPAQLLILDRATGHEAARISIETGYSLHTINGFEQHGRLIVDVLELDRPVYAQYQPLPNLFQSPPLGRPVRFVVNVERAEVIQRTEIGYRGTPDFPCVDPDAEMAEYDRCWMLGIPAGPQNETKFFRQLIACRWSDPDCPIVYTGPSGRYLAGEPVCIRNAGSEDEAVILCQEYNAETDTGSIVIFDAHDIEPGPTARITLAAPMHFGFHAAFVPVPNARLVH